MKTSRRNVANAIARAEKRAGGPPKLSKYAAKRRPPEEPEKASPADPRSRWPISQES